MFLRSFWHDAGVVLAAFGDIFYDGGDERKRVSLTFWVEGASTPLKPSGHRMNNNVHAGLAPQHFRRPR